MKEQAALSASAIEMRAEKKSTEQIVTEALDSAQAERRNSWNTAELWAATVLAVGAVTAVFAKYIVPSTTVLATESLGAVLVGIGGVGIIASNIGYFVDRPRKRHVAPARA